jgi:hypothetical protein
MLHAITEIVQIIPHGFDLSDVDAHVVIHRGPLSFDLDGV